MSGMSFILNISLFAMDGIQGVLNAKGELYQAITLFYQLLSTIMRPKSGH